MLPRCWLLLRRRMRPRGRRELRRLLPRRRRLLLPKCRARAILPNSRPDPGRLVRRPGAGAAVRQVRDDTHAGLDGAGRVTAPPVAGALSACVGLHGAERAWCGTRPSACRPLLLCLWLGDVTGHYRGWSVAASRQSGNDLAGLVFGEAPQGLGCNVAGPATRQGNLRGSGVVGRLAERADVEPDPGGVE